jgi:putative adhesin
MTTPKIARITTAFLFLASAGFLGAETARAEEWTKTFNLTGRPSVRIDTNDGAVHVITGAAVKQVDVRVDYRGYQLDRDFTIDSRQEGNGVVVSARIRSRFCVFCVNIDRSFKIEVRMPTDAELQVETGDGSVDVERVNGNVDIHTGDGHIRLEGARGQVRLRTGDGHIETYGLDGQVEASSGDGHIRIEGRLDRLSVRTGDGPVEVHALPGSRLSSEWSIRTGDGSVDLSVPNNVQANVDAHTNDGRVSVDIPIQMEGEARRTALRGKLNGGGELLTISTGDGSIRIHQS